MNDMGSIPIEFPFQMEHKFIAQWPEHPAHINYLYILLTHI